MRPLRLLYSHFDLLVLPVLAFILLLPKFPLIDVEGTYVNVRLEDFVIVFLYGLWGLGVLLGYFNFTKVFAWKYLIGFLIYGFLVTLAGIYLFHSIDQPHLGLLHWMRRVEYVLMYFVAAATLRPERIRDYVNFLLFITAFAWVYGVLQWQNILPGVQTLSTAGKLGTFEQLNYVISTFAAHYDFGTFLMLMTLLSLAVFFSHKDWKKKLPLLIFILMLWWMARLVYSRAAYLALIIGTVSLLALRKNLFAFLPLLEILRTFDRYFGGRFSKYTYNFKFDILPQPTQPSEVVLQPTPVTKIVKKVVEGREVIEKIEVTPTTTPATTPPTAGISQRLDEIVNVLSQKMQAVIGRVNVNLDPSGNIRLQEWQDVLAKTKYKFLTGGGYYSIGLGADSDYVRHLAEVGVIGLSIFALILFDFTRLFWRKFYKTADPLWQNLYLWGLVSLVGLAMNAVFIDVFEASKIAFLFWFMMGMLSIDQKSQIKDRN